MTVTAHLIKWQVFLEREVWDRPTSVLKALTDQCEAWLRRPVPDCVKVSCVSWLHVVTTCALGGTYGATKQTTPTCSGPCAAGFFCKYLMPGQTLLRCFRPHGIERKQLPVVESMVRRKACVSLTAYAVPWARIAPWEVQLHLPVLLVVAFIFNDLDVEAIS